MHLQPVFCGVGHLTNGVAESLFRQGVTLPSGSVHGPDQIQRVCDVLVPLLADGA